MNPTEKYLSEVKARAEKATPGPWFSGYWSGFCNKKHIHGAGDCVYTKTIDNEISHHTVSSDEGTEVVTTTQEYGALLKNDSMFIANSRTDIPRLVQMLEVAMGALKCNETFHRLGGIDDCEPCKAQAQINRIAEGKE